MNKSTLISSSRLQSFRLRMLWLFILCFMGCSGYAQYCAVTPGTTTNGVKSVITTGGVTNINNQTAPGGTYSDFTAMSVANFVGGSDVAFTVLPHDGTHGIRIWIDWNNNSVFDTAEMVYSSSGYVSSATGTIAIPAGTALGNYRMRIVANWLSSTPTPCGDLDASDYGEAEDYTFAVIAPPTCMPPSNVTITNIAANIALIGWTAPAGQTAWEVLILPAGSPAPTSATTGFIPTTNNPYTANTLTPSTSYDVYVRTNCGATDGKSYWAGPKKFMTTQIPAEVNFSDDFEATSSAWSFTSDATVNKWVLGSAVSNGGTKSLYVSNDNGVTNAYYGSATSVVHAYRDLQFPANASEVSVTFNWKALGQDTSDYLRVWLMPSNYQPVGSVPIVAANGGILLGEYLNLQNQWQLFDQLFNVNAYAGQVGRLVFEWRNNSFGVSQPPAAIDDVQVKLVSCPRPIHVLAQKNNAGNIDISWTPTGSETEWEIIIQESTVAPPTDASTGISVTGSPHYLYTGAEEGVIYVVYVRAKCSATDKSKWSEVITFSDFNPPACANIDITPPNLEIDNKGNYFYCQEDGVVTINLDAGFDASKFKSTNSYTVESIPFEMPFPTVGGVKIPGESDDIWSAPIQLPFPFCFYGNNYTVANVGTNGVLSFAGPFQLGDFCDYGLENTPLPNADVHKNAIMLYQDIDRRYNKPKADVNYQVLGTYPCRALVVSFNDVPYYNAPTNSYDNTTTTFQMVIYEITNIIEIYVKKKPNVVGLMSGPINGGRAVLGIQNATGTQAVTPPDRNTGVWEAIEEAYRFTPSGDTDVTFAWYANGEFLTNDSQYSITIDDDTDFKAVVSYPGCGAEDLVLTKEFSVKVSEQPKAVKPQDIRLCAVEEINLREHDENVLSSAIHPEKFDIDYYLTESEAETQTNPIADPEHFLPTQLPQTIYIRMQSKSTECYAITTLNIVLQNAVPAKKPNNIVLCVYDNVIPHVDLNQVKEQVLAQMNPDISSLVYYTNLTDAENGTNAIPNPENYQAPRLPQDIFIVVSDTDLTCDAIVRFQIVEGAKNKEFEFADFEICTNYVLPPLPPGFYYSSEDLGKGTKWNVGEVLGLGTHKIFVNSESNDGCISTGAYTVTVINCAVPKGISPNGDGLNDAFDLTTYRPKSVHIFNRYGKEVFSHNAGYTKEWIGQDKSGKELPSGTYYYRIVTETEDLTGYVQLVREVK